MDARVFGAMNSTLIIPVGGFVRLTTRVSAQVSLSSREKSRTLSRLPEESPRRARR